MNPDSAIAYRKQVSALLEAVLNEDLSPRTALNCWPMSGNADPSVRCAYTMLWYFESDEDRRLAEMYYSDLQINALREANGFLKQGEGLPVRFLHDYKSKMAPSEYDPAWTWREPLDCIVDVWKHLKAIIGCNPWLRGKNPPKKQQGLKRGLAKK